MKLRVILSIIYLTLAAGYCKADVRIKVNLNAKVVNTATTHQVILSWNASTATNVTGIQIYKGTTSGGENYTTPINATLIPNSTTTYTDTAVTGLSTYYYTAEFYCPTCVPNTAGIKGNSNPSAELSVTIPGDSTPAAPVLSLQSVAMNQVPLYWMYPNQPGIVVDSVNIFRCHEAGCPGPPKVAEVTGNHYTDTCTYSDNICYYVITANLTVNGKRAVSPRSNIEEAIVKQP